ncbi:MAG TPA: glycosyltransferase family 39 protein, partial [Flavilitoribacter sp.]|nr:glycosyltransferase family 39 protein [Flavilitoribacter sp.]
MNFFSTSALLVWLSCLFAACFSAKKDRFCLSLIFLTAAAFLIRLFAASDPWLHFWDERYHFLVAKNMMESPFKPMLYQSPLLDYDYRAWSQNHIWLHKPPMGLWLIAGSFKVFGVSEFAGRLPSVLLSSASVVLAYQAALHFLKDRWMALACAFFQSVNGLTIELASGRNPTDHVDTIFYFFILAGIWSSTRFAISQKAVQAMLAGVFLGLAVLTKWLAGLIIVPVFFMLILEKTGWKKAFGWSVLVLSTGVLIALPWQWH